MDEETRENPSNKVIDPVSPFSARVSWVPEPEEDRTIEENWLFTLRRQRYRSRKSGKVHDHYVVHLADAVNVIAVTPELRVLLVEQFRAGSGRDSLETPGGLLDPGEDPLEAAARELLEETGYAGDSPRLLGTVWSNPSILSSRISTILIPNARPVAEPRLDEGEELKLQLVPATRIPLLIANGTIGHALAVQGLLWWLVSQLPDTPLELPIESTRSRFQFNLSSLMFAVLVVALPFALFHYLGQQSVSLGAFAVVMLSLPFAWRAVNRWLDPSTSAVLLRDRRWRAGLWVAKGFTFFGLSVIVYLIAIIAAGILG